MFHVEHLPGGMPCRKRRGRERWWESSQVVAGGGVPDAPRGVRAAARELPGIGQASAEGSRPLPTDGVHGCFVGNGLDRSGDVCRCCMVKYCCGVGAAYMRPGSVRQTGAYGKPAGRACPAPTARQSKSVHQRSHPGAAAPQKASLPLTPSPQTPLLPPSRRFPPFPPYRRC